MTKIERALTVAEEQCLKGNNAGVMTALGALRVALKLPEDAEKVVEEGLAGYDYLRMNVVTDPNAMTRIYAALSLLAPALARIKGLERYEALYAEARETLCSCNLTNTPEKGPEYNYTCEWCSEHPEGSEPPPIIKRMFELEAENKRLNSLLSPAPQPDPGGTGRS